MKEQIKQALEKALAGPWRFGNTEEGKRIILGGSDKYVCNVQIYQTPREYGFYDEPTREANANLIANAPTWLKWQNDRIEELEKAIEIAYNIASEEFDTVNQKELIRLTLAEALGKEE